MNLPTIKKDNLPATIEELHQFILIGKERLKAHQAKIRAIEKVGLAHTAKEAALEDAQDMAEVVLEAEGKLGLMLEQSVRHQGGRPNKNGSSSGTVSQKLLPPNITKKESHHAQTIAKNPDVVKEVVQKAKKQKDIPTPHKVIKEIKHRKKEQKKLEKQNRKTQPPAQASESAQNYQIILSDIAEGIHKIPPESVDIIITDPPYSKEFIPLYAHLSAFANHALKPGHSMLVMVGQSYLPKFITELSKHMTYHWAIAYLTPGGQSPQIWPKKVNTFWKPVLWFTKGKYSGEDWFGDVVQSQVNDNDKRFHEWGQSESGMARLIENFTYPGETIADPFMGGGTTGVVAVQMGRFFLGLDRDHGSLDITRKRLENIANIG